LGRGKLPSHPEKSKNSAKPSHFDVQISPRFSTYIIGTYWLFPGNIRRAGCQDQPDCRNGIPFPNHLVKPHHQEELSMGILSPSFSTAAPLSPPVQTALRRFLEAEEVAPPGSSSRAQYALEISVLRSDGLSNTELRGLIQQGLVEHWEEITGPRAKCRRFRPLRCLTLPERTCCLLTPAGVTWARQVLSTEPQASPELSADRSPGLEQPASPQVPFWDAENFTLWWGPHKLLDFRPHAAPILEAVLTAFQEQGWSQWIKNPFEKKYEADPVDRLNNAIKNLNKRLKRRGRKWWISFHGRSTGVRWQKVGRNQR
jgi:hypothetical protein